MKEEKNIVKKQKRPIVQKNIQLNDVNSLIQCAIQNQSGVEQLKELMKMKYEHEEREATKKYHQAFCEMQAEFPIITKNKTVKNKSGMTLYKYATLPQIIKEIRPYLKKHGFSYHWTESSEKEGCKRVTCHITGYGHSESAFVDIPIINSNDLVNSIQQRGVSSTYGERYSLVGILGIMADEDTDGRTTQPTTKNITPEKTEKEKVRIEIDVLFKKLGCDTDSKKRAITGLTSFSGISLDELKKVRNELQKILNRRGT